ncbi:MAG: phasin family protein [Armatimonadota bacterium]
MFETLRKVMLFGLGAAAMSRDKMQQAIDDLVARGEVTIDEGKKLYDELSSRVEEQGRTANEQIKSQIRDTLKDMGVADRTQIAMLESRIEALEMRVRELSANIPQSIQGPEIIES